jgi:hypothetical protein
LTVSIIVELSLEADMSKPVATPKKQIPIGILVSVSGTVCKPERPTLKRKTVPRTRARQVPWQWILTGGSVAWALVILVIGLCAGTQKRTQQIEPQPVTQRIAMATSVPAPAPKPVVQEKPLAELTVAEPVVQPPAKPIEVTLKRLRAEVPVVENDYTMPAISISPEIVENTVTEEIKPQKPKIELIPSQLERKVLDVSPFANCEQIGTNILFVKDPPEAFKRAKAEKKLVFMVHLSGNLEDKGFT